MAVSLKKGQKISLSKEKPGLSKVIVGLGWDEVKRSRGFFAPKPKPIDCDAFALLLKNGKLTNNKDVVYYGNLEHETKAVKHMGDNLTGAGDGDDEQIVIELDKIPAAYDRIILAVNIYKAFERNQHFGMIENAFIRLVDSKDNREMCIYNLTEDYSGMTAMLFGEIYRHNGEWKFNAIGQGTKDKHIGEFANRYV